MLLPVLLLAPALSDCRQRDVPGNESSADNAPGPVAMTPGTRAVTIGEGGAGLSACVARGKVINLSPAGQPYLPVRAAPFAEAQEIARLDNGATMFVCTRSMDQGWRGVIIPPADQPDTDCGVRAPVAVARAYAGPCRSGWVPAAFVQLSGD